MACTVAQTISAGFGPDALAESRGRAPSDDYGVKAPRAESLL